MLSLFRRINSRRSRQSLPVAAEVTTLESRELLSAHSLAHGEHAAKKAPKVDFGGFWSAFAMTESTIIIQNGKKVEVDFYAPSDWQVGQTSGVSLNAHALGKGKVKKDSIHFVVQAQGYDTNTGKTGLATLTFDEKLTSPTSMQGTVKIEINGNTYAANECAIYVGPIT